MLRWQPATTITPVPGIPCHLLDSLGTRCTCVQCICRECLRNPGEGVASPEARVTSFCIPLPGMLGIDLESSAEAVSVHSQPHCHLSCSHLFLWGWKSEASEIKTPVIHSLEQEKTNYPLTRPSQNPVWSSSHEKEKLGTVPTKGWKQGGTGDACEVYSQESCSAKRKERKKQKTNNNPPNGRHMTQGNPDRRRRQSWES